jgi:hypothetical protein
MSNIIFIHIALLSGWYERITSYLLLIKSSGLLEKVSIINLCFVGDSNILDIKCDEDILQKIRIHNVSKNLKTFEVFTQKMLYDYCCNNKDCNVLYIHTKGVGNIINLCIEDWIYYMLYFLIERHEDVAEHLLKYDTVGVDLRDEPTLHYSGNFWWAKSYYIASLPDPLLFKDLNNYPNPLNSERHNQEFWICYNKDKNKHYSMWDCGINCYERHLHRYSQDKYKKNFLL